MFSPPSRVQAEVGIVQYRTGQDRTVDFTRSRRHWPSSSLRGLFGMVLWVHRAMIRHFFSVVTPDRIGSSCPARESDSPILLRGFTVARARPVRVIGGGDEK